MLESKYVRYSATRSTKKVELGFTGSLSLYYSDLYSDFDTTKSVDYNRYREASQYIMYGKRVIKGFELNDPFPLLVEDSADIIKFFKDSKIVPYSYTESGTGNSLRPLLSKISRS